MEAHPNPNSQPASPNLVLTGFMGTGKSTVGRLLAARMERPFVDMDEEIELRAGLSIREIFATQGENAFRQRERSLCRQLAQTEGLVIATGGGTLVDDYNRRLMAEAGLIVCLNTEPEVLLERLKNDMTRPLLQAPDPELRLRELLAARAEAYAALPHHVDNTYLSTDETVEAVIQIWHSQTPAQSSA